MIQAVSKGSRQAHVRQNGGVNCFLRDAFSFFKKSNLSAHGFYVGVIRDRLNTYIMGLFIVGVL